MALPTVPAGLMLLSAALSGPPAPWSAIQADSEQRSPVYLGSTPRELAIEGREAEAPALGESLREKARVGAGRIRKALRRASIELEAWPVQNDDGKQTWAFARWRVPGTTQGGRERPWQWLDVKGLGLDPEAEPVVIVARTLDPSRRADRRLIFTDFLKLDSLYEKPVFGECVWTDVAGSRILSAWLAPERAGEYSRRSRGQVCRVLPQISRFNGEPRSFVLRASRAGVEFPSDVTWKSDAPFDVEPLEGARRIGSYRTDLVEAYRRDVQILSGEMEAVFPRSGFRTRFERKSSAEAGNQLLSMVDYLEERYARLGIRTRRQPFVYRGIPQANLVAIIPGSARGAANRPVLLADHFDTAFSQEVFERTGKRVSVPGADDNMTAAAALLRAAEALRDSRPVHDIWLTHLTGEEFPSDCLGARHFVSGLLREKQDISGLVLMDMIGYRAAGSGQVFQVNAGQGAGSVELARIALDAARVVSPLLEPRFRSRYDDRSYLYNTDGVIFAQAGFPVILLNEHINILENLDRPHYHETTDTSDTIDFEYATSIVKVAIETAARLAGVGPAVGSTFSSR